jgi:hypothetical protein
VKIILTKYNGWLRSGHPESGEKLTLDHACGRSESRTSLLIALAEVEAHLVGEKRQPDACGQPR